MKKLKKLDNKGMTLMEALAAGVVLSICSLIIFSGFLMVIRLYGESKFYSKNATILHNALERGTAGLVQRGNMNFTVDGNSVSIYGRYAMAKAVDVNYGLATLTEFNADENLSQEALRLTMIAYLKMSLRELKENGYTLDYVSNDTMRAFLLKKVYGESGGVWDTFDKGIFENNGITRIEPNALYIQPYIQIGPGGYKPTDTFIFASTGTKGNWNATVLYNHENARWYWRPNPFELAQGREPKNCMMTAVSMAGKTWADAKALITSGEYIPLK